MTYEEAKQTITPGRYRHFNGRTVRFVGGNEMSWIKDLQKYVHHVVDGNEKEANQIAHLHGVALAAAILAKKRGENAELATMAGLLHAQEDMFLLFRDIFTCA